MPDRPDVAERENDSCSWSEAFRSLSMKPRESVENADGLQIQRIGIRDAPVAATGAIPRRCAFAAERI